MLVAAILLYAGLAVLAIRRRHTWSRIERILWAYLAAAGAVATVLAALFIFAASKGPPWNAVFVVLALTPVGTIIIALVASLPALFLISFAEWRGIRSPIFYAASGMLASWVGLALLSALSRGSRPGVAEAAGLAIFYGLGGLMAGLTYWAIAGRQTVQRTSPPKSSEKG